MKNLQIVYQFLRVFDINPFQNKTSFFYSKNFFTTYTLKYVVFMYSEMYYNIFKKKYFFLSEELRILATKRQ